MNPRPNHAVAIVGVGTTQYRRTATSTLDGLVSDAIRSAVGDAGLQLGDVDGLVTDGSLLPRLVPAAQIASAAGINPKVTRRHALGGAGVVGAPQVAQELIAAGVAEVVVVVLGLGGVDHSAAPSAYHAADPIKAALEMPMGWFGQPVYFAAMAQRYRYEYGDLEPALAEIVSSARAHAARTPGSARTEQVDLAAYQHSPFVAEPLRVVDCCLISEGAAAYVVTSAERAKDLRQPPVWVAGVATACGSETESAWFTQRTDLLATPARASAAKAFAQAGITPADVDIAEIYDCFSITTLLQLEDAGFCPPGQAPDFVIEKGVGPDGHLPVNTHGGLLAHAFCLGALHVIEAVHQLRGDRGPGQVPKAEVAYVAGLGVPYHASLVLTDDH